LQTLYNMHPILFNKNQQISILRSQVKSLQTQIGTLNWELQFERRSKSSSQAGSSTTKPSTTDRKRKNPPTQTPSEDRYSKCTRLDDQRTREQLIEKLSLPRNMQYENTEQVQAGIKNSNEGKVKRQEMVRKQKEDQDIFREKEKESIEMIKKNKGQDISDHQKFQLKDPFWDLLWESKFQELVNFQHEHSHCRVPCKTVLGRWVQRLRSQKKDFDESCQRRNRLTEEQIERLEEIGMEWSVSPIRTPWMDRYTQLIDFKEEYGHCDVPNGAGLGDWIRYQRKQKRRQGRLKCDRDQLLDAIGFDWKPVVEKNGEQNVRHDYLSRHKIILQYDNHRNKKKTLPRNYCAVCLKRPDIFWKPSGSGKSKGLYHKNGQPVKRPHHGCKQCKVSLCESCFRFDWDHKNQMPYRFQVKVPCDSDPNLL